MATYSGLCRSNYFPVRDPEAFRAWCHRLGLSPIHKGMPDDPGTLWGFVSERDDGLPSDLYNEQTEDWDEIDLAGELAPHLAEEWVAVIEHVGFENLRYLDAIFLAVNSAGDTYRWTFSDALEAARPLGAHLTEPGY